jgi:hypothetical protein
MAQYLNCFLMLFRKMNAKLGTFSGKTNVSEKLKTVAGQGRSGLLWVILALAE